jgi:hypothetical protein
MSKQLTPDRCRTAREFDRAIHARHPDVEVRQSGSHRIYRNPDNGQSVPIPQHNGNLPTGTRRSIIKMLAAIGLAILIPFALCNLTTLTHIVLGMTPGIS